MALKAMILAMPAAILAILPATASAQVKVDMRPIEAPSEPGAIPLNTGTVAGMPAESWFLDPTLGQRAVRNVSHATLTPFLPVPSQATGAAVVIAPGGAFKQLGMDNEGWSIARWLQARGIAAFVLKYRLTPTPAALDGYRQEVEQRIGQVIANARAGTPMQVISTPQHSLDDVAAAMRMVHQRATEWKVDPARIGLLGFSAGAIVTLDHTLMASGDLRPAFLGNIYGSLSARPVPKDAPPLFAVRAADDNLFLRNGFGLIEGWSSAKRPVELHVFASGGHGFGMGTKGTTTIGWLDLFHRWLTVQGFTGRAAE